MDEQRVKEIAYKEAGRVGSAVFLIIAMIFLAVAIAILRPNNIRVDNLEQRIQQLELRAK